MSAWRLRRRRALQSLGALRRLRPLVGDLEEEELAYGGLLPLRPGIVYQPPALARLLGEVLDQFLDVPCRLAVDGMANGSRT